MKNDDRSDRVRKKLGYKIRLLREQQGFSQGDLAYRVGINRSYLSEVENGHRNLTVDILTRLADIMSVTLSELFENVDGEDDPMPSEPAS